MHQRVIGTHADHGWPQVSSAKAGCECPRPVHSLHGCLHLLPVGQHQQAGAWQLHTRQHVCAGKSAWPSLAQPITGACSAAVTLHAVPDKGAQCRMLRSHSYSSAKVRLPCCSCASVTHDWKLGIWAAGQSGVWGLGSAMLCPEGAHVHAWDIKRHPILGAAGICWISLCAHLHILAGAVDSRSAQ